MSDPQAAADEPILHRESEGVPVLTGPRVTLRALRHSDGDAIVEQCLDPLSIQWTTVPLNYTVTQAHEFVSDAAAGWAGESDHRTWAIEYTTDAGKPAFGGTISVRLSGKGRAEIGFGLHPAARGRGVAVEAQRLTATWFFDTQDGRALIWKAHRGNLASWRVAWAAGFTYHGLVPALLNNREGPDDIYYAVLRQGDALRPASRWFDPDEDIRHIIGDLPGLRLRAWRDDDIHHLTQPNHPSHFMPDGAAPTPENYADWLLRSRERAAFGKGMNWCIADAETDLPLGDVCVFQPDAEDAAEIGYQLFPAARGKGVGKVAAEVAVRWAFSEPVTSDDGIVTGGLGVRRVTARASTDNHASTRILGSLGFSRYGVEPAVDQLDTRAVGLTGWSLLKSEYVKESAAPVDVLLVSETDWRRLRAVRIRSLAESPEAFTATIASTQELTEDTYRQRIREGAGSFLAVVNGFDAGMVGLFHDGKHMTIWGMWVDPTMRGSGVGAELLGACIAQTRRAGDRELWLHVYEDNAAAIHLYEHNGFQQTHNPELGSPEGCRTYRLTLD